MDKRKADLVLEGHGEVAEAQPPFKSWEIKTLRSEMMKTSINQLCRKWDEMNYLLSGQLGGL